MRFHINELQYRYPSRRSVVYGTRGMVCTASHLAAQAGLDILKKGGNAVDAAIASAICLTVIEPVSNGIGSDAFAMVWTRDGLFGLNGSGYAPAAASADRIRNQGYKMMPVRGWLPVTVPGAPASWAELWRRFGRIPFGELFEPAVYYGRAGFPVSPVTAHVWEKEYKSLLDYRDRPEIAGWFSTFLKDGQPPEAGSVMKLPDHAQTLEILRDTECESLYRGKLAEYIDRFSQSTGGLLRGSDMAGYHPLWVSPVHVNYRGCDVWEMPPNGHGIVPLMALQILKECSFCGRDTAETLHMQFEAMKMAFADGHRYISDPRSMTVDISSLLSEKYAFQRKSAIGEKAASGQAGNPRCGDTVYLCTADEEGNMVSYIQSNYQCFGSGVVLPGSGIAFQDRGANFDLDPDSVNCIAPGKRPYHTIIPGFLTCDGQAVGPFGVMGGFMQPQGHVQLITNMLDFGMNPQEALDCPRWQWTGGRHFEVERGIPASCIEELRNRGHEIDIVDDMTVYGRGQMICRNQEGVLMGATEPRADGTAAAW